MAKWNVFYGKPPFNQKIGEVEADNDRPEIALQMALKEYVGVIPDGEEVDEELHYELHPVVELAK